jgi:hypothetical protein
MARPRKRLAMPAPPPGDDGRMAYLRDLRKERDLFTAKEASQLLGISHDRFYGLKLPPFDVSERGTRWAPHTIADFLERHMADRSSQMQYLALIASSPPLAAVDIAEMLRMHTDVVGFMGLPEKEESRPGRIRYNAWELARWLEVRIRD